jgi:hypothetical protein
MVAEIDAYLEAGSPYREIAVPQPGGGSRTGTMSVGLMLDMVEALREASGSLGPAERRELDAALAALDAARGRPAYRRVLLRELHGQMDAWRWFLGECAAGDPGCSEAYPTEARKRSRIHQLLAEADRIGLDVRQERDQTAALDKRLRDILTPPPGEPSGGSDSRAETDPWWLRGRVERT